MTAEPADGASIEPVPLDGSLRRQLADVLREVQDYASDDAGWGAIRALLENLGEAVRAGDADAALDAAQDLRELQNVDRRLTVPEDGDPSTAPPDVQTRIVSMVTELIRTDT